MTASDAKTATIYRMVMPDHLCPFGLKSVDLLKRKGYRIDDHWLKTRAEHDAFKAAHNVETTPQTFIGGKQVGGYEDLKRFFGMRVADPDAPSYRPVIVVFAVAALMSLTVSWATSGMLITVRSAEWFIAFSMCILALLKLQDIESFSIMFLGYDLLARRFVPYSYVYPYAELLAGVLMVAGALIWVSVPVALFIGTVGAFSVFKAVYIEKREIKCACVGGNSKVPLGFVSLTENLMMIAMAVWMVVRHT
jgi:glutaredoxin